jgi:Caspase domain
MVNAFSLAARTTTNTIDNGDGTVTTITVTYNLDGSKSTKKKTQAKVVPENVNRSGSPTRDHTRGSFTTIEEATEQVKKELKKVLGIPHADNSTFAHKVHRAIPAEILLIASQDDVTQAQESDSAKRKYGLPNIPNTQSESGSLATSALLQMLFENPKRFMPNHSNPYDCRELIKQIQARVKRCSSLQEANPVISSSRPLGPPALKDNKYAPFYVVPPGFTGTRRALLICVVGGEDHDLKGPPNDVQYIRHFLMEHCGFQQQNITELRDDRHAPSTSQRSTKKNILDGFAKMVKLSKPKDVVFIQFSGHG